MRKALVSIHDVMPGTLGHVEQLLGVANQRGIATLTLLVVPGAPWSPAEIDRVRRWQDEGYRLAGHGWLHHCKQIRGWRHRLHSWLISRDVAEHLATDRYGCLEIINRCAQWFADHRLKPPVLYVPPAWALGPVSRSAYRDVRFRLLETQTGVIDTRSGSHHWLPLLGFEADTLARCCALRASNGLNQTIARFSRRPLRISLHPNDLGLRLGRDVLGALDSVVEAIDYSELIDMSESPNNRQIADSV